MIRKLRIKLIFASMLSLLLVFFVIFSIVGGLSYRRIVTDADSILTILAENGGRFPMKELPESAPAPDMLPDENRRFSAELPYESRYFSVSLTAGGHIASVNTGKIAAVDTATAIEYAQSVLDSGRSQGFMEDYRYAIYASGEGSLLIFLDRGREMISFRAFLLNCVGVSAAGLLAVLLLLIFLSARIVKPFSGNYEKQRQFITDAGHELKTPLTIIDADAEVLEMDIGENEWLRDIQSQTKRLAQLTNSLIQLSRMEERPQTQKIEFSISDLAEETLESFQALAKAENKHLSGHIQPMLSLTGDETSIRQLLSILMDNAIKYSDGGGKIELTLEKQKNSIRLGVFNTAESVSRESLPRLFDRFYRADQSRNSRTGGYGLGLSIAAAIVAAHRGKIAAATQDEKSLLITAVFPI